VPVAASMHGPRTVNGIMDQQKRFVLAMAISGVLVLIWQYFFAPPPVTNPPGENNAAVVKQEGGEKKGDTTKGGGDTTAGGDSAKKGADEKPLPKVEAKKVEVSKQEIITPKFKLGLTNANGGRITSIELLDPEQYQKAGDLLAEFPEDSKDYPFGVKFDKNSLNVPADATFEVVTSSKTEVVYRYVDPNGRFQLNKSFKVNEKHPFLLDFNIDIINRSSTDSITDKMVLEITGYQDPEKEKSFLDFRPDEIEAICRLEGDTERELYSAMEEIQTFDGVLKWGGINTRYFMWSVVPEKAAERCVMEKSKGLLTTRLTWDDFSIAPGATHTYKQQLFAGVKDLDVLSAVGSDLSESVDYGILTILAKPMRWMLNLFHSWVGNWGLAIILLTLLIKLATWPFTEKSYANAERMKEIQPKLDELRSKYENDQQRLAEETMKLFKENSFNPLGGCFPMILQMPILYGLYVMIINSVELYHAEFFLWYTDLSARDPYFVLPIMMGALMFAQQQFMTPTSTNPQQAQTQAMMKFMPIMFTAFMLFLPSGLVLYYSLNLVLGILQQYLIRRKFARRREKAAAA